MTPELLKTEADNCDAQSGLSPAPLLGCIEFIKTKLAQAEQTLKAREEMKRVWSGGTDKSWRAVGCKKSRLERLEEAATHGRIAGRNRAEVQMFEEVLKHLESI